MAESASFARSEGGAEVGSWVIEAGHLSIFIYTT